MIGGVQNNRPVHCQHAILSELLNSRVRLSGICIHTTTIRHSHARPPVGIIRGVAELGGWGWGGWGSGAAVPLQTSPSGGEMNI